MIQDSLSERDQWLLDRRSYLGASDMASILRVSKFQSEHECWLVKRGLIEIPETIAMRQGLYLEPFIADEFFRATGIEPRLSKTYRHPQFPFIGANPDREITINGVEGLLELKNVSFFPGMQFGTGGADAVPESYLVQCMAQLIVTRKKFVILYAMVDGREMRAYMYSFDPELFANVQIAGLNIPTHIFPKEMGTQAFSHAVNWWNRHIIEGIEPKLSGLECDTSWVQSQASTYENGLRTNTDPEIDDLCKDLEGIMKTAAAAELLEIETKNRIKAFMAERKADTLESTVGDFTWKTNVRGVATFRTPFQSRRA